MPGSRGILLLDLQKSKAIIGVREIGIDLNRLLVFILRRRELLLREVLISFFDMLSRSRGAATGR